MFSFIKNKKGFTLLDTILTTLVLSTGILATMVSMQNSALHSVGYEQHTVAIQLAKEKIESIMADNRYRGYAYAANEENYQAEQLSGEFAGFVRRVEISEVSPSDLASPEPGSGLNKVNVIVSWQGLNESDVTVSTLLANYDAGL